MTTRLRTTRLRTTRLRAGGLVVGVVAGALVLPGPAWAGQDEVRRGGSCSGGAHWSLKVKKDDGRLEVEAEIDSNVGGQAWRWRLGHNGSRSAAGRATTGGSSGSFEVERRMVDLDGTDRVVLRARHGAQRCHGVVRL